MCDDHKETIWRNFPQTAEEFEKRFATEHSCEAFLASMRWNGHPVCDKCGCKKLWTERSGTLYECTKCHHHMSLTSGTLFHGTRKPLKLWFRAIFEVCVRRNGVSAADLQRILGLGCYETAWVWLHKIRRAMVSENRDKLKGCAQVDETFVGGVGSEKQIVLVLAEEHGRVRAVHVPGNHAEALKVAVEAEIDEGTTVKTDGHAGYNEDSLGDLEHDPLVQSPDERKVDDHLQLLHWMASNLKRWLLGTHHGGVQPKHLQAYLDEFVFRYNRRNTKGVARIVSRCLENMVSHPPMSMMQLIDNTQECRNFQTASY